MTATLCRFLGARFLAFERSGRAPFIEEPERFSREVAVFLTG